MVLFKRKPVQYVPRPAPIFDDQEVWVIGPTEEIFTNYNDYLSRMDYYKQKRFICEISGHSQLDFFTALRNEMDASLEVDDSFPDSLREPILRKVQFSTISRIDNLVDHIFDEFKQDFYPGESVTVLLDNGDRLVGVVREKTKFPELKGPDGTIERKAFARYFVSLLNKPDEEALVDADHVVRDRKTFTKQMLRSFLKNSVQREAWTGAPWLVKSKIAKEYRISTEVPTHLSHEHQMASRKTKEATRQKGDFIGTLVGFPTSNRGLPELKPKGPKGKNTLKTVQNTARRRQGQYLEYQRNLKGNPAFDSGAGVQHVSEAQFIHFISQNQGFPPLPTKGVSKPPPPPPVKYPIEDLEIRPDHDGSHRPPLKYLSQDVPSSDRPSEGAGNGILMNSVGLLLETWNTLNVYCEIFQLDSFTFDDYVEALQFTSEEVQCELLVEIHCAVLKKLVNSEKDLNGQVQITLPVGLQEESDEDSSQNTSTIPSPTPEPEIKPRATRSSLAKAEAAEIKAAESKLHRAAEIDSRVRSSSWRVRLRRREFSNGRWVVIIVGLLNLFTKSPRLRKTCDEILTHLAPLDMEATDETAISQYAKLDINLRVKIVQFLCELSLETQAIRGYMEECTYQMTQFRKEKVEQQRTRKACLEDLRTFNEERKALQPEAPSPVVAELEELEEMEDLKVDEPGDDNDTIMDSEEEEEEIPQRSLRRANDRAAERKRKLEEERERKERAEAEKAKKPTKQARQLEKLLKKIEDCKEKIKECEEEVATLDNDLREADCARTRVLGKDRFWNRYYWFERNGMPFAGLPTSSTASSGYANGCIWVQGPDNLERQGFIELSERENAQYRAAFHVGVPERKMLEEGPTHTFTATEWGYYDDPDALDKLIAWLDVRGVREIKLRKELQAQREKIVVHMAKRKEYLCRERSDSEPTEPVTRVSTRTKTYVDPSGHRCMKWTNSIAVEEFGHLHSEPPKGLKKGVARVVTGKKAKEREVEDEGRQTRASNKQGKPLTRQGSRYAF